jgi:phosphogluconate dehydratase
MLMEVMGLHLPGSAFITPGTPLRDALTAAAAHRAVAISQQGGDYMPIGHIVDEKSIVNAIAALHATGGSTNHTLHLVAIARAAGIVIDWNDFDEMSKVVPLLTRIYPNGDADVNHFQAAGGPGFVIRELLDAGLAHDDVNTILGRGLRNHCKEPFLGEDGKVVFRDAAAVSGDENVLRPATNRSTTTAAWCW